MDKVKAAYTWIVNWVAAHPTATVNIIIGAAVAQVAIRLW
jgi:hypothetical protein